MVLPKLQEKVQCVKGERKLNFGNEITEILVLPVLLSLLVPKMHARGKWKPIVAMSLPKMGGKKKKKKELWQLSCQKWRGKEKKMLRPQYFAQQITDG